MSSSHAFIRALKSSENETGKIELVEQAWSGCSVYIPGKSAVIVEWIVQKLSDDKDTSR